MRNERGKSLNELRNQKSEMKMSQMEKTYYEYKSVRMNDKGITSKPGTKGEINYG